MRRGGKISELEGAEQGAFDDLRTIVWTKACMRAPWLNPTRSRLSLWPHRATVSVAQSCPGGSRGHGRRSAVGRTDTWRKRVGEGPAMEDNAVTVDTSAGSRQARLSVRQLLAALRVGGYEQHFMGASFAGFSAPRASDVPAPSQCRGVLELDRKVCVSAWGDVDSVRRSTSLHPLTRALLGRSHVYKRLRRLIILWCRSHWPNPAPSLLLPSPPPRLARIALATWYPKYIGGGLIPRLTPWADFMTSRTLCDA